MEFLLLEEMELLLQEEEFLQPEVIEQVLLLEVQDLETPRVQDHQEVHLQAGQEHHLVDLQDLLLQEVLHLEVVAEVLEEVLHLEEVETRKTLI